MTAAAAAAAARQEQELELERLRAAERAAAAWASIRGSSSPNEGGGEEGNECRRRGFVRL